MVDKGDYERFVLPSSFRFEGHAESARLRLKILFGCLIAGRRLVQRGMTDGLWL